MEMSLMAKQKIFCEEYIFDWNATRSYKTAFPHIKTDGAAGVEGHKLLRNPKIQAYLKELQADLEKQAGISRLKVLLEYKKLAFSSIAHLHNTWLERKDFEKLTDEQKDCISEIVTQTKVMRNSEGGLTETEYVKVKLYDKARALEGIRKMLGHDVAEKIDIISSPIKIEIVKPS